jgi:hypothetical protein
MCVYSHFVNSALRTRGGQAPKRSFVTQAFTGACMLRDGAFGITTATQAAFACGVPPGYVAAAATILDAGDDGLTNDVLSGRTSMFTAAKQVETRAALIAAFRNASPADRVALGDVVGADAIFDEVIVPALDPTASTTVVTPEFTAVVTPITAIAAPRSQVERQGHQRHRAPARPPGRTGDRADLHALSLDLDAGLRAGVTLRSPHARRSKDLPGLRSQKRDIR